MSSHHVTSLFSQLGETLGLPTLAPNENGYCIVQIDDKFQINFMVSDTEESLTLFSQLGVVDAESQPELLGEILSANLFWRDTSNSTLGMEPDSGAVLLMRQLDVPTLTYPVLESVLEGFITTGERWFERLAKPEEENSESEDQVFLDNLMPSLRA